MTKYHYLYVEDDALSREVMETLLLRFVGVGGLTLFADSRDFMARLAALDPQPDFILLDIHVEPHNGYELLAMLRSNPDYRACKLIAVTASVMLDEVRQLQTGGFDGALAKPLDMSTFPELIADLEAGRMVWQVA
ncbi:MAG: response regulator [Anaerolineales bacterium]|nr:response regulator [Anaerolineales bacterium]